MGCVCRLDDPYILLTIMLLELLIVLIKLSKFIRKNVSIRHKVKVLLSMLLLHPDHVETEPVFAGDLVALRKMIDLLILVQALVKIAFAA